jgi:hypothetical protein
MGPTGKANGSLLRLGAIKTLQSREESNEIKFF